MEICYIHSLKSVQNLSGTVLCHLWNNRQHRAKGAYCPFRMKARVKFCTRCQEDGQIITFWSLSYSFLNHLTVRNLFWSNQLSWGYHRVLERTVMVDRDSWLRFRNKQLLFFPLLLTCCIVYIIHVYNSIQYIYYILDISR